MENKINYDEVLATSVWTVEDVAQYFESKDIPLTEDNIGKAYRQMWKHFLPLLNEEGNQWFYESLDLVEDFEKGDK